MVLSSSIATRMLSNSSSNSRRSRSLRIKIGRDVQLGNYVLIRENVKIGDGCIIGDDVEICSNVKIGNNVQIGAWCTIMDGVRIKDNAYLSPATDVTGE